ncbi:hypothetical protein [Nocardia acididurans]|nr:hypothetical protein [Nocardia acididurans]
MNIEPLRARLEALQRTLRRYTRPIPMKQGNRFRRWLPPRR